MLADRGFPALKIEATIIEWSAYFAHHVYWGGNVFNSGGKATGSVASGVVSRTNQLSFPVNGSLPRRVPSVQDDSR